MYQSEIERDEKEYLTAGQQSEEINYNYGGQTVNSPYAQSFAQPQPPAHSYSQPQHPLYPQPQPQPQAQVAQQDYFSGGAGLNTNLSANSNAFDNVDISRGSGRLSGSTPFGTVHEFVSVSNKKFQNFLDSTTPHTGPRWLMFAFLVLVFILRVALYQGFYVVAYALGIYLLNIFLLFLSPKFDPAFAEDESGLDNEASLFADEGDFLPGNSSPLIDEFRPFVRRLPEFKFWYNAMTAMCVGLACTMFSFLDIPVFWPILLMYFVILFALTMRRQIQHMIKYKYLPFDIGKKAYA